MTFHYLCTDPVSFDRSPVKVYPQGAQDVPKPTVLLVNSLLDKWTEHLPSISRTPPDSSEPMYIGSIFHNKIEVPFPFPTLSPETILENLEEKVKLHGVNQTINELSSFQRKVFQDTKNREGNTILHLAVQKYLVFHRETHDSPLLEDMLNVLKAIGMSSTFKNYRGDTPLHVLAQKRDILEGHIYSSVFNTGNNMYHVKNNRGESVYDCCLARTDLVWDDHLKREVRYGVKLNASFRSHWVMSEQGRRASAP